VPGVAHPVSLIVRPVNIRKTDSSALRVLKQNRASASRVMYGLLI
jgi:hypothetical protein